MSFSITAPSNPDGFDPSQFKIQPDGSFKISIRAMAAMAGIDHAGLVRSLKSAGDENALPCARSLAAQGFSPGDVSTWGETGGIPENAAPFILEHYGLASASPSTQARAVLLAFSRVGINAYLKERLGQLQQPEPQRALPVDVLALTNRTIDVLERLGGMDERAQMLLRDVAINYVLKQSGGTMPELESIKYSTISEYVVTLGCPAHKATPVAQHVGKALKRLYREENGRDPKAQPQLVNGRTCKVALYELDWLQKHEKGLREDMNNYLTK